MELVQVKNTFIDLPEEIDEGEPLDAGNRAMTDPTGKRGSDVVHLDRDVATGKLVARQSEPHAVILEAPQDEDEDDEDDSPFALERTTTVSPGSDPIGASVPKAPPPPGQLVLSDLISTSGTYPMTVPEPSMDRADTYDPLGDDSHGAYLASMAMTPWMAQHAAYEAALYQQSLMHAHPAMYAVEGNTTEGGPPFGVLHTFHQETKDMGNSREDFRQFTKVGYEGRLSVVSESRVHADGVQRFLVQFTSGELSRADGVGFVFSSRLPCAKNIQRIVSIFLNQRGQICMRVFAEVIRAASFTKAIEIGDWVEMIIDLDKKEATFKIWENGPGGWPDGVAPVSTAEFKFGEKLNKANQVGNDKKVKLNVGHLATVVKNVGVTVTLGS